MGNALAIPAPASSGADAADPATAAAATGGGGGSAVFSEVGLPALAGLLPNSTLVKWRDGSKTEAIPCPAARGILTYNKILERRDFKEFVYRHLDSDVLVSSVLTENALDEKVLLHGISLLQHMDEEKKEQYVEQVNTFEDLVSVGVRVDLQETQSIIEKELELFNKAESSPFLRAFQRRLALLLSFNDCIATEQKAAKEQRRPRTFVTSDLTSNKYPQLQLLDGLKTTGLNMLLLFPICFPVLTSREEKELFLSPVEQLCSSLCTLSNLELFSTWSPAQRPLQSPIKLKISTARASDGNPSHAVDNKMTTFWSTRKTASAFWTVQVDKPCTLVSIKIGWRIFTPTSFTLAGVSEDVGAPKTLIISVQYDSTEAEFVEALIVRPDLERIKQGTWEQVYVIPSSDRLIASVKLSMIRPAASNTTGSIKMHSFQAFSSIPNFKWVDSLSLMASMQQALYPIVKKFPDLQSIILPAILSIIRSSGSLRLTLVLIRETLENQFPILGKSTTAPPALIDLMNLIVQEHKKVMMRLSSTVDIPQPDATFDKDSKSALVKISEEGFKITYEPPSSGFAATAASYCMLSCIMTTGTWVWEFSAAPTSLSSAPELDGCYLGVAKRPIVNEDYQISSDYYVVRCSNGDLFHDGKMTIPSEGPFLPRILSSDTCRFTYDSALQTLSLMINDNDYGVIFRDVQPGVSPVVLFTGEGQAVAKSRSVRLKQVILREKRTVNEKDFSEMEESLAPFWSGEFSSHYSIPLHLLSAISYLSQIRMEEMDREESLKEKLARNITSTGSILEYPFSIEVSSEVISSLVYLLQVLLPSTAVGASLSFSSAPIPLDKLKTAILSILRILDSQFYCLTKAGVDPATLGFVDSQDDDDAADSKTSVAKCAASVILALTDSEDTDIQMAASKVYARGAVLFLPTVVEKINLVLTLVRDVETIDPDTSKFLILTMIIKHLSKIDDVLEIFAFLRVKDSSSSPSFESNLVVFISGLLRIVADINISQIQTQKRTVPSDEKTIATAEFQKIICLLFSRFQEHLVFEVATAHGSQPESLLQDTFSNVLVAYSQRVIVSSERVLLASEEASHNPEIGWSLSQRRLRDSIVPLLFQPLLHSFVICKDNLNLIARILPHVVQLLETTSNLCRESKQCEDASKLIYGSIIRRTPRVSSDSEESSSRGGWKNVKAVFDSGESTYTVSEEGMVYTSQSQSNTCGVVNVGFSHNQKAAWEFQLLTDTLGDECSLFGAARLPLTSRCYNNSPDLWMRRAYNGHMYCQGRTMTMSPPLERIHPGDIVRVEFDGRAKTISYSVNGKDIELGFSDVNDTIYPACGSYRPGVSIRLIKVEVFKELNDAEEEESNKASTVINWLVTAPDNESRAADSTLKMNAPKDAPLAPGVEKWLTAKADRGVNKGIHSWSFEFSERSRSAYALGVSIRNSPAHDVKLAMRVPTDTSSLSSQEMAWYSDGTLWCDGHQVAENFGVAYLPLDRLSVVTMYANCSERTLSFAVDGEIVGVAFGPPGSNAAATAATGLPLPSDDKVSIFPAASLSSQSQTIRITTSGFNGTTVVPLQLSLQKAAASVVGRLSAALLMGCPVDKKEAGLLPLLQSSLLIGGLEARVSSSDSDLSWKKMWARRNAIDPSLSSSVDMSDELSPIGENAENDSESSIFLSLVSESGATAEGAPLLTWLELINPEPSGQRAIMIKLNSYSFPSCEYPLIACLLKHTGLVVEAMVAYKAVKESSTESSAFPTPSNEMVLLWKTVQQLRRFLRGERQRFKSLVAAPTSPQYSDGIGKNTTASSEISGGLSISLSFPSMAAQDVAAGEAPVSGAGTESELEASTQAVVKAKREIPVVSNSQEKLELFYGNAKTIAWRRQTPTGSVDATGSSGITVVAVGVDFDSSFIFLHLKIAGDNESTAAIETTSTLTLDGALEPSISSADAEFLLLERSADGLVGCFRFDVATQSLFERIVSPTCEVRLSSTVAVSSVNLLLLQMPTPADIGISLEELKTASAESLSFGQALPLFADLCSRIEVRARFLLGIAVASSNTLDSSDEKTKQQRMDVLLQRQGSNQSGILQQMRSHDGQERWKRVIDFLRVHSQIRRQLSQEQENPYQDTFGERSPLRPKTSRLQDRLSRLPDAAADYDSDAEDYSLADSTLQACYIFAVSDGALFSTTCVEEIMMRRRNRATQRIFAMQALQTVLNIPDVYKDPFCLEELLLFVKAALMTPSSKQSAGSKIVARERVHYLVNLEGCPSILLLQVQRSFAQLFGGIANLVTQYTEAWDSLSYSACKGAADVNEKEKKLSALAVDSESHLTLGPLRLLLSLWTMSYSNRDHKFIMDCGLIPTLHKILHLANFERIVETWYTAGAKLVDYYSLHCERFKDTKKWFPRVSTYANTRSKFGSSFSCRAVLLNLLLMPFKEISEDDRYRLGLDNSFQSMCATLGAADVLMLNNKVLSLIRFREETEEREKNKKEAAEAAAKALKEADITARLAVCGIFDTAYKEASITLSDHSRVATLRLEDPSSGDPASVFTTVCYDFDAGTDESGNYFEVEVMTLGGGDLGIGLADRETVSVDAGLGVAGSYCYKGDNGHKLGASATSSIFPPFQQGDTIGCGIDTVSRAIFYTRNGELLGTAFEGMVENKLWAVICSFATSGNDTPPKVKINFGLEPFLFAGNDGVFMSATPSVSIHRKAQSERNQQIADVQAAEALAAETALAALSARSGRRSRAPTMELNNIDEVEKDLMAVSEEEYRKTLELLVSNVKAASAYLFEFNSLRSYCGAILRFILVKVCDGESVPAGRDVKPRSEEVGVIPSPKRTLMKERSSFGTPKFLTLEDGLHLREGLVASMVHQLLLGATYLSTAEKSISFDGTPTKYSLPMNQTPPRGENKSIQSIQAAQLGVGASASLSSDNSTNPKSAVLEVLEVERVLYENVSSLSTLLILNKSIENEISKPISLATQFLLLQHGSARIKTVVTTILRNVLPDISPAEAENALSSDCKASLATSEDWNSPTSGVRRQKRRIPDGVVRMLLMNARESLAVGDDAGPKPFGYGDMALARADENINLIQHLFEAPMWTELVACNITDALRSANALINSYDEGKIPHSFDVEQRNVILGACAACTVLSGLGTLRAGSAIVCSDGTKGTLIRLDDSEQQAYVLLKSAADAGAFAHTSDVEKVELGTIRAVRSCVHVDLSRLSQPLLPQLTNLMKCLLEKTSCSGVIPKAPTAADALLMRLNFVVSNAVSTLLDRQPDLVIDATHDANVIGNVICMSLFPCGLETFSSATNLTRRWNQMQARALETTPAEDCKSSSESEISLNEPSVTPATKKVVVPAPPLAGGAAAGGGAAASLDPEKPSVNDTVTAEAQAPESEATNSVDGANHPQTSILQYSREELLRRRQLASSLLEGHAELGTSNLALVQQRIEYFMGDTARAHASLTPNSPTAAADGSDDAESGWLAGRHSGALPNQVEFSSENLLTNAESQQDGISLEVPYYSVQNSSIYELDLISIEFNSSVPDSAQRIPSNLPSGSYVLECDSEGPLTLSSQRKRLGQTVDAATVGKDVIVSYFDANLGFPAFELVDTGGLKVVESFFDKKELHSVGELYRLDRACMILRLRRIAAKLLIEGNLNLNQGSFNLEDWLRFVKLTTVTTMMNLDVNESNLVKRTKVLSSLCSALIARSRSSLTTEPSLDASSSRRSSESTVVAVLVRDILETFSKLTTSSICLSSKRGKTITNEVDGDDAASTKDAVKDDKAMYCSSLHPFVTPMTTTGKFDIPSDWKGVMVSFHPKCATPSKLASLDFFKSLKSMEENSPAFSYSGPSSSFRPFILTDTSCLYYRFRAPAASDRPLLGVIPLVGPVKIDFSPRIDQPHNSISVRADSESAPVGLGEDDTLFNLFDQGSKAEKTAAAVVTADCESLTEGCWFFEVVVDAVNSATSSLSSDRVGLSSYRLASDAEGVILGADKNSVALTGAGEIIHGGKVVASAVEFNSWAAGDIIGCLFDLSKTRIDDSHYCDIDIKEYCVRFAINGVWSEPILGRFVEESAGSEGTKFGMKAAVSVSRKTKLSPNFGENDFKFKPPADLREGGYDWQCLLARPLPKSEERAWGYHFCVKPLRDLHMKVTRSLELISRIKPDEGQRPLNAAAEGSQGVWVWRAKASEDFLGCGDIITTDCKVPRGAIIVDKSQCVFPASYKRVFVMSKNGAGVTVWRPIPPSAEYVSLGDVITPNASGSPPPKEAVLCVPKWALKKSKVGAKVYKSKRGGSDAVKSHSVSLWAQRNCLGTFFGSPSDNRHADATVMKAEDTEVKGIDVSYTLSLNVSNDISGEWCNDEEVLGASSISWSAELLDYLLETATTRSEVLNPAIFSMLVKYATSNSSPAPLIVIPLLIKMIRLARELGIELPLNEIDGLCKSILKKAQSKAISTNNNSTALSNSILGLVDLVVEAQSAQVAAAAIKDMEASKSPTGNKDPLEQASNAEITPVLSASLEASPNDGDHALPSAESALVTSSAIATTRPTDHSRRPWWDRDGLVTQAALESVAAISLSNVKSIFLKDQIVRRLKQVLIFLAAMGATPSLMMHRLEGSPDALVPVSCRYPKLIVAKVWHDYASACAFAESEHPYLARKFEKRITFPGADKLRITMDSRTSFGAGAQLTLTVGSTKAVVTSSATTMNFQGNDLLISFDVMAAETDGVVTEPSNPANDWGWALVVHASGPIFESSTTTVELEALDGLVLEKFSEQSAKSESPPSPATLAKTDDAFSSKSSQEESTLALALPAAESASPPASSPVAPLVLPPLPPPLPSLVSAPVAGGSSARESPRAGKKKELLQCYADERVIELVTAKGVKGCQGFIAVPHASEVEVKLTRPNASADDAKFVRVVVIDYKDQTRESEDQSVLKKSVKVLMPTSNSQTVKFSVKTPSVDYSVFSATKSYVESTLAAEDAAQKVAAGEEVSEESDSAAEELPPIVVEELEILDPSVWRCEQCTFANSTEAHVCEVCGYLHANLAWSCAVCTFVNAQANRNCSMCASPHHAAAAEPEEEDEDDVSDDDDEADDDDDDDDDDSSNGSEEENGGVDPQVTIGSPDSVRPQIITETAPTPSNAGDQKDVLVITLKGKLSNEESFLTRLEASLIHHGRVYTPRDMQMDMKRWTSVEDAVLLEFINTDRRSASDTGLIVNPGKLILPKKSFLYHPNSKLASFNLLDIQCRMLVLEAFNKALDCILPILNLQSSDAQSLGATLRRHNRYVFMSVKEPMLEKTLQATATPAGSAGVPAALSLDNLKSLTSREKGEIELTTSQCCFAQAFRQLRDKDPMVYRYIFSGDRVFSINFHGESGIDAGGVFREGVSRIIEDLFSPHFNLLLLCPNGQHETHTNLDKFVPNPAHTTALALEMFEFMGRLMAMSLRAKLALPFELPSIVWKQLVGEEVGLDDLMSIDAITCHLLTAVSNCEEDGIIDEEIFVAKYGDKLRWSYNGSDGIERELRKGSGSRIVTFESRLEWCEAVKTVRLGEFDKQIAAIARGMNSVVSMRVLQLFSWQQLEILISGDPRIDIDLWKSFTDSSGVPAKTVTLFWKVMESLSPKEQSGFIRFAWGRSRLPPAKDFHVKMKFTRLSSPPPAGSAHRLPIAHTCFFSVEMPDYSTEEEMRHGLLTAINFGIGGVLLG